MAPASSDAQTIHWTSFYIVRVEKIVTRVNKFCPIFTYIQWSHFFHIHYLWSFSHKTHKILCTKSYLHSPISELCHHAVHRVLCLIVDWQVFLLTSNSIATNSSDKTITRSKDANLFQLCAPHSCHVFLHMALHHLRWQSKWICKVSEFVCVHVHKAPACAAYNFQRKSWGQGSSKSNS